MQPATTDVQRAKNVASMMNFARMNIGSNRRSRPAVTDSKGAPIGIDCCQNPGMSRPPLLLNESQCSRSRRRRGKPPLAVEKKATASIFGSFQVLSRAKRSVTL